jgi:hypothetical protein
MNRKSIFKWSIVLLCFFAVSQVFGQDLSLDQDDLLIELRADGGFHLFIRKKPDIASVLLTESTRDPALNEDNFAYRASEWNPVNGDEIRLLDGVPIPRENGIYSLISSTPVLHPEIGSAFHIYIPWYIEYGYADTRNGAIFITDGTYLNIRAFSLPYADYRGSFFDNPYIVQAVQTPPEKPEGNFMKEAEQAFIEITTDGGGDFEYASNPADLIDKIDDLLRKEMGKSVDVVFCVDTTGSMTPYIDEARRMLVAKVKEIVPFYREFRVGMVLFKDYNDEYLTRVIPFTRDLDLFQRNLNAIRVRGGGDIPEAVYEALYDGADKFPWAAESRLLILFGDAPPHPRPRGRITKEMVTEKTAEKDIRVSAILLSQ